MNSKISVYGSTGFIGSRFVELYKEESIKLLRYQRNPETPNILYFISTTHNYHVHTDITLDVKTNLEVLCTVLKYCKSRDIVFNFISSWFVYGKSIDLPAREDSICNPTGFYSITKKCAEDLIISFCNTYGVKYRIIRLCNVLGRGDKKVSPKKNAITWMINQLKNNEDIDLYDNGTPIRDVMHIDDVCRAIKTIMDEGKTNDIYNVGSGQPNTIGDIIESSRDKLKSTSKINYIEPSDFHKVVQNKDFWMNVEKLTSLGFTPQYTLEHIVNDLCQ
jgi:nucleoside-diphosphate-sugar epimerase